MKDEKARPQIKPSSLNKEARDVGGKGSRKKRKRRGKPSRCKTQELEIHEERIVQPDHILPGSAFKGDQAYVVQELAFTLKNTKYWRARYQSSDGESVIGELPVSVAGSHFGPMLRSDMLSQHDQQHVL